MTKTTFWRQIAQYFGRYLFLKKKCLQIIAQFVSKIAVFGHYLEIAWLDFSKNFRNGSK